MGKVTLGLLQHACSADPAANLKKTLALAEQAARPGREHHLHAGALPLAVLLPERGPRQLQAGRDDPRPDAPRRSRSWRRSTAVVIIASLFEKRASGLYHNTAAVIDADGSLLGIYRKMHIPDDPLYYEKFYFTPGDTGFRAWKTRFGRIGVLICWDQWYPEAARLTALQGAEILFYPTAIGWHPRREEGARRGAARRLGDDPARARRRQRLLCRRLQPHRPREAGRRAPASSSGARASSPARAARSWRGPRPPRRRSSSSRSTWPQVDVTRTHWPFLRDRRIDAYGDLTKRFRD